MNSSDIERLTPQIYNYLGYHGVQRSTETDELIAKSLREVEQKAQFNYIYIIMDKLPDFLKKQPYLDFFEGSAGVMLCAMTLGIEIDRLINRLFRTDISRAAVVDSCASAYLEFCSDNYEKGHGMVLSPRFCPGYGGSSVADLPEIFGILRPERIGIKLNESNFMMPSKSMAGVIAVGKVNNRSCSGCFMLNSCNYLKDGVTCYSREKK